MNNMKLDPIKPSSALDDAPAAVNYPQLTVSELALALKRTLEDTFGYVRLRGEVSGYRGPHASGHAYFSLKDASARIDAVIWKTVFARMRTKPEEGMEVLASGRITSFPAKSSYQIVIDSLEPAGAGALMAVLEARRRKLAEEGLFDQSRKKPLPYLPRVIGVVTSPSGAVIRDIIHRLTDRFPSRVVIWPVRVQGDGAAAEIAAAIQGMNSAMGARIPTPDVLIVARGGGSLEDLWSFNDEDVVRAAASSRIPLISAVGHETDWTLLDHVADVRAPTPTAAAELCVPVWSDLASATRQMQERNRAAAVRFLAQHFVNLRSSVRMLPSLRGPALHGRQRLDSAVDTLQFGVAKERTWRIMTLRALELRLSSQSPRKLLSDRKERKISVEFKLRSSMDALFVGVQRLAVIQRNAWGRAIERAHSRRNQYVNNVVTRWLLRSQEADRALSSRLADVVRVQARLQRSIDFHFEKNRNLAFNLGNMLNAVNYMAILNRGFTLVLDRAGHAIVSAAEAEKLNYLNLRFKDGDIFANIGKKATHKKIRGALKDKQQDRLF